LEDVGKDTYHHTFFEMLGNWSFGDYFKEEAIGWAWELLTKVYKLPTDRIYATYFEGNEKAKLPPDEDARKLWSKFLPANRILPFGMKDNFWEMGETGPCGPCTEIHFDRIGGRDASTLVNRDDPTVIEIWNNVFIQFNRESDGSLKCLPSMHVDTGMGLERLTSILQNVNSNYDTDVFGPIFNEISKSTGARPYSGKVGNEDTDNIDMAYRVIADHIRTLTFAITDGALPGNEGRNYVLRRILRRAVRYGRQILKAPSGFFSTLVPVVVKNLSGFFPELNSRFQIVSEIIKEEEKSFENTLDRGIEHFLKAAEKSKNNKIIVGEDIFMLYDTFGFPVDLTTLMAAERGYAVDMKGYEILMQKKIEDSRGNQTGLDNTLKLDVDATAHLQKINIQPTDDSFKYVSGEISATLKAMWNGKSFINEFKASSEAVGLVFDKSNFYSESGGQIYDTGIIKKESNIFEVENVQTFAGYVLHMGKLKNGCLKVGESIDLLVDSQRRNPIMSNHTFTHVLNFALKSVLGSSVDQKGSLVDSEKLRFDFSHNKPLTIEELKNVEDICNQKIKENLEVYSMPVKLSVAKQINGLRAVFGETYPDPVTVVSIGVPVEELISKPDNTDWIKYSIELCGGTHLKRTSEAKVFVIVSENGIAKGVRRIIAWTGDETLQLFKNSEDCKAKLQDALSKKGEELSSIISAFTSEFTTTPLPALQRPELQKMIDKLFVIRSGEKKNTEKVALLFAEKLSKKALENKEKIIVEELDVEGDRKALSSALQILKEKVPSAAIMLLSKDQKNVVIITHVSKDLQSKLHAGNWAKDTVEVCGGKGGGKPEAGQASSSDSTNFLAAILKGREIANDKLN
jgi:alanyl-tRNA synthetase